MWKWSQADVSVTRISLRVDVSEENLTTSRLKFRHQFSAQLWLLRSTHKKFSNVSLDPLPQEKAPFCEVMRI